MPELGETELKKQLASGELCGLYLIGGEEKYLVKRSAGRLLKKAGSEPFPEFNQNEFGGDAAVDSFADAALALPFFAEHKYVFVSDFNVEEKDAAELQKLYELLETSPDTTTLVFWYPTLEFDGKRSAKWKKLLGAVGSRGGVILCARRSAQDLQKLLLREAEKAGCILSRQNAERILDYAGWDVTQLLNEMEKLCAYALGREEPEITADMIEELVPKTTETTVFLMSDALVAGNYEKAYQLLDTLFYQNEEPVMILGALSSAYVDLYRVKTAAQGGLKYTDAAAYGEYKGKEFRLRNADRSARSITPEALRDSLSLLLEADSALKGSRLEGRIVLEELIAKLLLAAQGEKRP